MRIPDAPPHFIFLLSVGAIAFPLAAYADITLQGNCPRVYDAKFGGNVLKIGYGGWGAGTVAAESEWVESSNLVVGCCPNNNDPATLTIYGKATTKGDTFVSVKSRSGICTVDGGTWRNEGNFYLGELLAGTLSVVNGGLFDLGGTFRINTTVNVNVDASSKFQIRTDETGTLGKKDSTPSNNARGGIVLHAFPEDTKTMAFEAASSFVVDARAFSSDAEKIVFDNLFLAEPKYGATLKNLLLKIGENIFSVTDEELLNTHLRGLSVLGFEDYEKSFVVSADEKSVALHLSAIVPEPSAFGLLAGILALAFAGTCRRRRKTA